MRAEYETRGLPPKLLSRLRWNEKFRLNLLRSIFHIICFWSRTPLDFIRCFDKHHLNMFGSELRKFVILHAVPLLAGHSGSFQFVHISSVGIFIAAHHALSTHILLVTVSPAEILLSQEDEVQDYPYHALQSPHGRFQGAGRCPEGSTSPSVRSR